MKSFLILLIIPLDLEIYFFYQCKMLGTVPFCQTLYQDILHYFLFGLSDACDNILAHSCNVKHDVAH